ncbi:sulfatase [Paenibacillus herberti]|uniref:Sulfatase n=1 Tax=Paenibacillus herberti TaxID=1619309 RepID=A0A229NYF8_9BACL|nr:sulfatase [Paenibacillus herberti]
MKGAFFIHHLACQPRNVRRLGRRVYVPVYDLQPSRAKRFWLSPFVLFTLTMIFKMYLAAYVIDGGENPLLTLVTGLPTVWAAFFLIELFARKRKIMGYLIVNLAFTAIYFAVIMYYKYFGIIVTYHALSQVGQVTEVKGSVFQLLHPYFMLIFVDIVLCWILLGFNKRLRSDWRKIANRRLMSWRVALPGFILMAAACFAVIWPNRNIANELVQTERMGIVNYEIFLIATSGNESFVPLASVTQKEIDRLKGLQPGTGQPAKFGAAEGRNIIVVQLEAFQNFILNKTVDGQEITPNLNKLIGQSMYFPRFYQQAGSGNTSDAEFLMNTSLYVPLRVPASQAYSGKSLPSLPKLVETKGYETMTFHTNDVSFWNRKELYRALGFNRYYDTNFFGDEDVIAFGASDEVLYRKSVQEMAEVRQETGKPFYSMLISMSAHHPYNIKESKVKLKLSDKYKDSFVGDYMRAQNYADYALGQLIQELKDAKLWENSMLVIYGDHMGLPIYSLNDRDLQLLEELVGQKYDSSQMLNIPLIVTAPGALEPSVESTVGGQSDIMPTIANLIGSKLDDQLHFGQDLLNERSNLLPERYYLPSGSFINDREIFIPGTGYADGKRIELPSSADDSADGGPGSATQEQFDRALKLLRMSDSYVRSLPSTDKDPAPSSGADVSGK